MQQRTGNKQPPQRNPQPKQTGALFGLPDAGHPFQGIGGPTAAPARSTKTPDLTQQVALARARRQRLQHGGLLTPAQRKAEDMASTIVATKTRFATPPPEATPPPARRPGQAPASASPPGRAGGPAPRGYQPQNAQRYASHHSIAGLIASGLGKAHEAADIGFATGLEGGVQPFRTLLDAMNGGLNVTTSRAGAANAPSTSVEKLRPTTSADLSSRIAQAGLKRPDIRLNAKDISFLNPGVAAAYAKGGPNAQIPFRDLEGATGWTLKPDYKARLIKNAHDVQGWSYADLDNLSATDLIYKAYNKPDNLAIRILKGVAGDVVQGGSQTVGGLGFASEVAQGRGRQALGEVAQQGLNLVPGLGQHPWTQEAVTHPLFALTALHAGLKSAGSVGHVLPRVPGERVVPIHGTEETINRGPRNRNLYTAVQNAGTDWRTAHTPGGAKKAGREIIDTHVRTMRNLYAEDHIPKQVAYKQSTYHVKDKRATQLMAWKDFGGAPGLQNGIAHFEKEVHDGNPAAPRILQHLRDTLAHPPTGPNEDAFVAALHDISAHTSDVRQNLGLHGAIAQDYRKWETPIEMAASMGDPLAITAKAARDHLEELQNRGPAGYEPTPVKRATVREVGRDVTRHTKKAEKADARLQPYREWQARGAELRKRRPKPPAEEAPTRGVLDKRHFDTLREASAAAKKLTDEGAKVKVEKTNLGYEIRHEGEVKAPAEKAPLTEAQKQYRAELKAYQAEVKAHNKTKPPKPTGVARTGGVVSTHRTEVRQQGARLERITPEEKIPYEQAVEHAKRDAAESVQAFAEAHTAAGGIEPSRIARTKPPSGVAHPSRLAGKNRVALRVARGYRSTGTSITRGEFAYDVRSPLHENAEAQRLRQHIGTWNEIFNNPLVHHVHGDGEQVVPPGFVATPVENMRSAAKTTPRWDDSTPVSIHESQREHGIREQVASHLAGRSAVEGEVIPRGVDVLVMPKVMHDRIIEWAKPRSREGTIAKYERANAAYQRILIGVYPSTWLGNAPGSVPLAVASGALHPAHYAFAARTGRQGFLSNRLGIQKDQAARPASTQGMGAAGSSMGPASNVVMRTVGKGREASMLGEDFSAAAAWSGQTRNFIHGYAPIIRKLIPAVDKAMPDKWKGKAHELGVSTTELAHAMASGKWGDGTRISHELDVKRNQALDHVEEFMSASVKPHGDLNRAIGGVVLFHNWLGHILKLTLVSLPINHPRRALLLDSISLYGNQYRQEHGVYPSWMLQFFPLMKYAMPIGNGLSAPGTLSAGLGQLTPISSASNLGTAGTQITTGSPLELGTGLTSPLIQPFLKAAIAMHDNSKLKAGEPGRVDPTAVVLEGLKSAIPGYRKFVPASGHDLAGKQRKYYEYVANPSSRSFKRYEIPYAMRPGGRPIGGFLGDASRVIGLPLEWSPTGGIPTKVDQGNAATINSVNEVKRALKK